MPAVQILLSLAAPLDRGWPITVRLILRSRLHPSERPNAKGRLLFSRAMTSIQHLPQNRRRSRGCDLTSRAGGRAFLDRAANQLGGGIIMNIGTDFVLWIGAMNLVTLCAVVLAVRRGGFGDH
jgi:hypothetical protein